MFHYVYRLDDHITGEFYFGSRSCECDPEQDTYMGSMVRWKPNIENLVKTIIQKDFNIRSEANLVESHLIKRYIHNSLNRNYALPSLNWEYNIKGEKNGMWGKHFSDESKQKMRDKKLGLYDGANNPRARKLYEYDLSGNLTTIWDCATDCVLHHSKEGIKLSRGNISGAATHNLVEENKLKRLNRFVFSFVEIYNLERFNLSCTNWDKTKIQKLLNEH